MTSPAGFLPACWLSGSRPTTITLAGSGSYPFSRCRSEPNGAMTVAVVFGIRRLASVRHSAEAMRGCDRWVEAENLCGG